MVKKSTLSVQDALQDLPVLDAAGNPVSVNPSMIVFPTDIWGVTTDLKDSIRTIAARVSGCPEKFELVMKTLKIAEQHIKVRYNDDHARITKSNTPK